MLYDSQVAQEEKPFSIEPTALPSNSNLLLISDELQ